MKTPLHRSSSRREPAPRAGRLGRLTPPEIEALRQDGKRVSEVAGAWLRKNRPDLLTRD